MARKKKTIDIDVSNMRDVEAYNHQGILKIYNVRINIKKILAGMQKFVVRVF